MIVTFKQETIAHTERRRCCFSGHADERDETFPAGHQLEALKIEMESPKRSRKDLQPYDEAVAARNPHLKAVVLVDSGTLYPDEIHVAVGQIEVEAVLERRAKGKCSTG